MTKKIISVALCLTLLASIAAVCFPANAAVTEDEATGYNRTAPVSSADDFTWDNANVYFLMTDRFYNGNTSNDHSYGRATDSNGNALSGWQTAPGTFHGGDFAGITKKINEGYFDNLGTNAIWISAPYEQIHGFVSSGDDSGNFAHYSYHGYYVLDYTETDANFGTKAEFKTMVDTAHKHGIRVVMDIVVNHAGYNNLLDMETYGYGAYKDKSSALSYMSKLTDVGGMHQYIDYDNNSSAWGKFWGNDWIRSGLAGYTKDDGSEKTQCLSGLPDFRTEQTKSVSLPPILKTKWSKEGTYNTKVNKYGSSGTVSDYITTWLAEWVSTYGVDGFRCDTAKHVELETWKKLKTKCSAALKQWRQNNSSSYGADWDEDFWMTGEHWDYKFGYGEYYTQGGFDSMINFSFSGSGVPSIGSINGLYQSYSSGINNQAGFNTLSYISSHDSELARGDLIYQGSAFQLMPGAIQVFYGDETNRQKVPGMGFDGHGGSGHSLRSDMNWDSIDQATLSHWQKVGKFRSNHVSVGAGDHRQISAYSASTGYTFERSYDDGTTSDGVICTIGAPANTQIDVPVSSIWSNGKTVTNAYDGTTAVVKNGKATFNSGANGTILIEGEMPTIHMSLKGNYAFYDSEEVTVSLRGADYAMASINGGTPFRVVDGQKFTIGEGIDVGTVFDVNLTATNSEETCDKSFSFKKKDPNAVIRVYFDNSKYKWPTVNVYVYDDNNGDVIKNADWPGEKMTYDSATGLYVYDVPDELTMGKAMFNAGDGSPYRYPGDGAAGLDINETNMLFRSGNTWEPYTGQVAEPTEPVDPSQTVTIYLDNSTTNYETPYCYYWRSTTSSGNDTWPGEPMTLYKDNVYKITIPKDHDMCIFSNNGGGKTGDLTIPGTNYIYKTSGWQKYSEAVDDPTNPTNPVGTKLLIGDLNLDGIVSVGDATIVQKAAAEMIDLDDDQKIAADCNGDKIVSVADATLIQKYAAEFDEDLKLTGTYTDGGSQPSTQPTTEPEEKHYIYCKSDWSSVSAYYWSDANEHMLGWPGTNMTSLGNNVFRIEVPSDAQYIIFSQNGNNQTGNIRLEGFNKIYENNGWATYNG